MIIQTNQFDKNFIREQAIDVALHGDVSSDHDRAVFFSGKKEHMRSAMRFCQEHKDENLITMLHTDAYKQLKSVPLFGKKSPFTQEEAIDISAAASARFAQEASGNVTAFLGELNNRSRSTFFTIELPALLLNDDVETINGFDKMAWTQYVQPPVLPRTDLIPPEVMQFDTSDLDLDSTHPPKNSVDNGPDDLTL